MIIELRNYGVSRRNSVYNFFDNKCHDCNKSSKNWRKDKKNKERWNLHHLFYPRYHKDKWDWINAPKDLFLDVMLPEIKEACILLCRDCHMKRHNLC